MLFPTSFLLILTFISSFFNSCFCVKYQTITVSLYKEVTSYISDSTTLNLLFSDDLVATTTILQQSIDIKLQGLTSNTDFTWSVATQLSNKLYQIKINYLTNIYEKQLHLYFINPYAIKTSTPVYLSLDYYVISCQVGPVVAFSDSENTEIDIMSWFLNVIIVAMVAAYLIIYLFRILKESMNIFWAWVDMLQLYNLFLFIDTYHFENVSRLLRKGQYLNLWYCDFIAKYSKSLLTVFQDSSVTKAVTSLPSRFINEEYTSFFLENALVPVAVLAALCVLVLASFIVCPTQQLGFKSVLRNIIQFSLPIRAILLCCCQVFLSAFLFFKNFTGIMNIIVSISAIAFYGLAMIAFMLLLNNGEPTPLSESISKEKYGSLYEGLILKAIMKRNFNLFFMGRKIIMAALVVFVTNEQMFQSIFILLVQIVFIGLIASKLPYEFGKNNLCMVISEFLLTLYLLLQSAWVIFDYLGEDFIFFDKRMNLSWAMHSFILCSIVVRVIGAVIECQHLYMKEQEAMKSEEKQVMQDNSMEENGLLSNQNKKGVHQQLLFHHQIKENPLVNQQNDDIENPDDFQFIEMPDINALIEKEKEEEKAEQAQKLEAQKKEEKKEEENDNNQQSDDEDGIGGNGNGNTKHSLTNNNEISQPTSPDKTKF